MKKILILGLVLAIGLGAYVVGRWQTTTVVRLPDAQWAGDDPTATAWRALAARVESAGSEVFAVTTDPQERDEALHYLAQLLSASLEMKLTNGDPARPAFTDWMGGSRKFLGDSPDATYHSAEISADHRYEVAGNRADARYLGIMTYGRALNGWNRTAGSLSLNDLSFDDVGNFRIVLSRNKPEDETDWLPLTEDVHLIMVRQYFHDRASSTPATLRIRTLDQPMGEAPASAATGIARASQFFDETIRGTIALADMLSQQPNSAEPPRGYNQDFGGIFYPTDDNEYLGTWFDLAHDEALVIEGTAPDALHWSASLQNRWLQSVSGATLNNSQIAQLDGHYRIVVAAQDPGTANWLPTGGRRSGLLAVRYLVTQGETPRPEISIVKLSQLQSEAEECRPLNSEEISAYFSDVEDRATVVDGNGGSAVNTWRAGGSFTSQWQSQGRSGVITGNWTTNTRNERCVTLSNSPDGGPSSRCGPLLLCGDLVKSTNAEGHTHGVHRLRPL